MKNKEIHSEILQPPQNHSQLSEPNKENPFLNQFIHCKASNHAYEYCVQEGCKNSAVICQKEQCQCLLQHLNCQNFLKVSKFNSKINQKIVKNTANFIDQIDGQVQKITDRVSEMLSEYTDLFKTFGLNKNDQKIVDKIATNFGKNTSNEAKQFFTGNNFWNHRETYKQANKQWFDYSLEKYKKVCQQAQTDIIPMFEAILDVVTYAHIKNRQNTEIQHFLYDSKILDNQALNKKIGQLDSSTKYLLEKLQKSFKIESLKKIFTYQNKKNTTFNEEYLLKAVDQRQNLIFLVKNSHEQKMAVFKTTKMQQKSIQKSLFDDKQKGFFMRLNFNPQHYEQSINSKIGLGYSKKYRELSIVEVMSPIIPELNGTIYKLSIFFKQNEVNAQMQFSQKMKPMMNSYGSYIYPHGHQEINGKSKISTSVSVMEVYQVFIKEQVPKPQIQNIFKSNINHKELSQSHDKTKPQNLFGNSSQANSLFQIKPIKTQPTSLFEQNS